MRRRDLIVDERCQMRVVTSEVYARELAEHLEAGGVLPPVVAFRPYLNRPGRAWLGDGFHRLRAYAILHWPLIEVDLRQGGLREATLFACAANSRHGLRPSQEDNRKAVATLLLDPEWGQWSSREIGRKVGVGHDLVQRLREQIQQYTQGGERLADRDGVKVRRGNQTYTMRYRDMTPSQQRLATQGETADCRPEWRRELAQHAEGAVRCSANLGESHAGVCLLAREMALALRKLDRKLGRII